MLKARILCVLALALLGTGCIFVAKVHYRAEEGVPIAPEVAADGDEIIGVALSGGGSRAAVFAAAGLEALWEHGLLEGAGYISSVSGGSIAASYYVKKRYRDGETIDAEFFRRFREEMRHDYWSAIEWRQFYKFRWLSGTRRAVSLQEVLDKRFLDGVTLGDLTAVAPHLLVNATLYDNGRRFVITTLDQDEVAIDAARAQGTAKELAENGDLRPMTFAHEQIMGSVPGDMPLSLAVAASASLPFVIGPVGVRVGPKYWHLGDGGMLDNTGVDTLEQVVLRKLQDRDAPGRALILALDGGLRQDDEKFTGMRNFHIAGHPDSVFVIPSRRAEAYHGVVWQALVDEEEQHELEKRFLRYTEVALEPHRLPDSCAMVGEFRDEAASGEILARYIAKIPTHLKIEECDADLMELLAHLVVHQELRDSYPMAHDCSFRD
jgi:predicted acylesterase/phospholipase RssA